jgi:glycosyltransferase involved in cell wall biosynthesis
MKPLVSILIPAFNAQKYLADTLRSAVAQTWPRKEIIVVDDGSTDRTLAIARQFEPDGVRVFTQKNQGAAATRNKAFSLSQGDYIQWLDADDLLAPDKIARQMEAIERCQNPRLLFSSAWGRFLYRYYRTEFVPTALWCDLSRAEWLIRKMGQNLHMQTATWLVSRQLTEAAGPWDTTLLGDDDGEYFCRVLLASDGVRFVPEAKVFYRATPNSLSYIGASDRKVEAHWRSMLLHIRYLRSLDDGERARAACVSYLRTWLLHFYPHRLDIVRQAEELARDLGGHLGVPHLSWKYSWIEALFGWSLAKRVQLCLPQVRWSAARFWDQALFRIENGFRP